MRRLTNIIIGLLVLTVSCFAQNLTFVCGPYTLRNVALANGARYTQSVAPGAIASLFGSFQSLAFGQPATLPLPAELSRIEIRFNGIAAPLFYSSPSQINLQIPWQLLGLSNARVDVVFHSSLCIGGETISLASFAPGLFSTNQQGAGQAAILIANTSFMAAPSGLFPGSRPVRRGEYISIFATG